MEILSFLIPILPLIINAACIFLRRWKLISLLVTLCGMLYPLLILVLNTGYGIGFGNPWVGVDWQITLICVVYIAALLVTHAFVPSAGIVKKISIVFLILAVICTLLLCGLQILNTIEHR